MKPNEQGTKETKGLARTQIMQGPLGFRKDFGFYFEDKGKLMQSLLLYNKLSQNYVQMLCGATVSSSQLGWMVKMFHSWLAVDAGRSSEALDWSAYV